MLREVWNSVRGLLKLATLWGLAVAMLYIRMNIEAHLEAEEQPGGLYLALSDEVQRAFHILMGVGFLVAVRTILLPKVSISDAIFARGHWQETGEQPVRAALILGWFIALAAFVVT